MSDVEVLSPHALGENADRRKIKGRSLTAVCPLSGTGVSDRLAQYLASCQKEELPSLSKVYRSSQKDNGGPSSSQKIGHPWKSILLHYDFDLSKQLGKVHMNFKPVICC